VPGSLSLGVPACPEFNFIDHDSISSCTNDCTHSRSIDHSSTMFSMAPLRMFPLRKTLSLDIPTRPLVNISGLLLGEKRSRNSMVRPSI
jgi:hypothetical protein